MFFEATKDVMEIYNKGGIKAVVDMKYNELKKMPHQNPITMANNLQRFCYDVMGIGNQGLWDYIDAITGVNDY